MPALTWPPWLAREFAACRSLRASVQACIRRSAPHAVKAALASFPRAAWLLALQPDGAQVPTRLMQIRDLLAKQQQQRQRSNGTPSATTLAVHSGYVATGTDKGEVRHASQPAMLMPPQLTQSACTNLHSLHCITWSAVPARALTLTYSHGSQAALFWA